MLARLHVFLPIYFVHIAITLAEIGTVIVAIKTSNQFGWKLCIINAVLAVANSSGLIETYQAKSIIAIYFYYATYDIMTNCKIQQAMHGFRISANIIHMSVMLSWLWRLWNNMDTIFELVASKI